ncbi:anoctamin-5 [Haematobia irritans]|uniref:anoctamin-5 n=1 Tax=Haematobia irritans TaxID=7368 RepID=UPI003F4F87A3
MALNFNTIGNMNEQNNGRLQQSDSRESSSSNRQRQHIPPYAIRVDSLEEDVSTTPITESNSHEDLIARDPDDEEANTKRKHDHSRYTSTQQFPRFLSVPALRNEPTRIIGKRQIVSSPAKSERMNRNGSSKKIHARRLSQDSGIVAGRLFNGADLNLFDTGPLNTFSTHHTVPASDNIYSLLVNDTETPNRDKETSPTSGYTQQHSPETEMTMLTPLNYSNNNNANHRNGFNNTNSNLYNEKWRPNHYKSHNMAIPLPTHLEGDSAEPSPTQAFGPKIDNLENLPGTAMHRSLALQLSTPPTPDTMDNISPANDYIQPPDNLEKSHVIKAQPPILEDQFAYKQLVPYEKAPMNSKNTSVESSLNGSFFNNSRKESKRNSMEDQDQSRRVSKQDREGLDSESLMFRDGRRKVDMVLAWEEEDLGVMTEAESRKRDHRKTFMENLIKEGLEVELEDKSQSFNECTYFLKIHLPWRLETRLAEVMNLKLPVKRFITISVKSPWEEENIVSRNINFWKDVWRRLTRRIQLEPSILEGETTFKAATANGVPEEQFIVKDRATAFTSAQRSQMVMQILLRTPFDDSDRCGIRRLLNDNTYLACFPLHEGRYDRPHSSGVSLDRRILYQTWAHPSQWYKKQPLCLVRKYFGDKISLYFCWLGFYTEMLVYPSIVGTLCFIYGLATLESEDNTPSKEICNELGPGNITLCPLCDKACSYQHLSQSCLFSRITYLFDNPSTVFFAIFMSFWATTFLELWKRKQSVIVWEWDLSSVESDEENRPEFETNATNFRINPVTREKEPYMSTWSRTIRFVITGSAVFFMIVVVLSAVLGTIIYRISMVTVIYSGGGFFVNQHAKLFTTVTAALINLIVIMILTRIYHRLAIRLTNLENPRTHTEYEDSYTFKIFFFEFMNFYSSLIYIAFFKGRFFDYPGDDQARRSDFFRLKNDICDPAGCLSELCIQLAIIMVGKQCWNNFMEYLFPKFYNWWRQRKHKQATKDESHLHMAWEQDYHMQDPGRLALFDEYLEMILQYGFVTLFVAAFPLAPLFALLNNVAEIRLDAYKMVTQARRPLAERVEDIGAWYGILRIITYTAVVSNAFVIAYTSDFIPRMVYKFVYSESNTLKGYIEHSLSVFNTSDYKEEWGAKTEKDPDTCYYRGYRNGPQDYEPYGLSPHYWHVFAARLAFVVVFEHVVFVITGIMQFIIPDIPVEVKTQMQREQLLAKEAKYQHGMKRAHGDSQDLISVFREAGSRQSNASLNYSGSDGGQFVTRRSWARRFSRLSDGLDAHVEVPSRPRRSMESTVWEVS